MQGSGGKFRRQVLSISKNIVVRGRVHNARSKKKERRENQQLNSLNKYKLDFLEDFVFFDDTYAYDDEQ